MNTQTQMNHIKELIQFLEIQNQGLNRCNKPPQKENHDH